MSNEPDQSLWTGKVWWPCQPPGLSPSTIDRTKLHLIAVYGRRTDRRLWARVELLRPCRYVRPSGERGRSRPGILCEWL